MYSLFVLRNTKSSIRSDVIWLLWSVVRNLSAENTRSTLTCVIGSAVTILHDDCIIEGKNSIPSRGFLHVKVSFCFKRSCASLGRLRSAPLNSRSSILMF